MAILSSGFLLHSDQSQCLRLDGIRLSHLEEGGATRVRGDDTRVATPGPQMRQQGPETVHCQSAGSLVIRLLAPRRGRDLGRGHGSALPPVLLQLLVLEQQWLPRLAEV